MSATKEIVQIMKEHLGEAVADAVKEQREKAAAELNAQVDSAIEQRMAVERARGNAGADANPFGHQVVEDDDGDIERFENGKGVRFLSYILRAAMESSGAFAGPIHKRAADLAHKDGRKITAKALSASDLAAGGAVVPPGFSQEIIEALQSYAVVQAAGPTVVPLNGSYSQPFINASATSYYVAENAAATVSEPTTGLITMTEHKLRCITPISNDLLRSGGPAAENAIRRNMLRSLATRRDLAFLRGDDTNGSPKGLLNWAVESINADGTNSIATITEDAARIMSLVNENDVELFNPVWFMTVREFWYLRSLRTANGEYAFPELQMTDGLPQLAKGYFLGAPVFCSTQLPTDLDTSSGGNNNEADILFVGDASSMMIGQAENMRVEAFPGGTYNDGANSVSGITRDQTVLAVTDSHDFALEYRGNEVGRIRQVTWGAP